MAPASKNPDAGERFACVHGHFYQPPRENPWIEAIERQPSAGADHDWNCRVARECYVPNGSARVVDSRNRILDLVNNYAGLSFNFGPTLLSWYEKAFPSDYERLIEADRESARRLEGHGNAIAQAYNHMIMPLCSPRDRVTQVLWGLADFRSRFGRAAEAMWLPETACNLEVLRVLIDQKMKYVILAPSQAERVRELSGGDWQDVSAGSIDPKQAYRCFLPGDDKKDRKFLDIFFYDGPLSSAIAFEHMMTNSSSCADRLVRAFDPKSKGPQLVSVSTDGESYGHHESFSDMGLAHLLKYELPARGVKVVNYGYYLARNAPRREVEIKAGPDGLGTAWSCAHGVGRWFENCGCGSEGRHQKWRRPLREALDWLRDELSRVFEAEGSPLLRDAWAARDGYIKVILDRSQASMNAFMSEHLKAEDTAERRLTIMRLMEMQRHAMMMYTSCGWFFSEISGIETVQNLKYAARALQLAREVSGEDLEREFLLRLKRAPSNLPEFGDGWGVYEKLVRPSIVTDSHIAAQYAIMALVEDSPHLRIHHYEISAQPHKGKQASGLKTIGGRVEFRSGITGDVWRRIFMAVFWPDHTVEAFVRPDDLTEADYGGFLKSLSELSDRAGAALLRRSVFGGKSYSLHDLFHDERARILNLILRQKLHAMESSYQTALDEHLPLAEKFAELGVEMGAVLRGTVELALGHWLAANGDRLLKRWDPSLIGEMTEFHSRVKAAGLTVPLHAVEPEWQRLILARLAVLEKEFTAEGLAELRALIDLTVGLGLTWWRYRAENRFFRILERRKFNISDELAPLCEPLAAALNISLENVREGRETETAA